MRPRIASLGANEGTDQATARHFSGANSRGLRSFSLALVLAVIALIVVMLLPSRAEAQDTDLPDQVVIFVIDLSGSMNEAFDGSRTKLDVAKDAFAAAFADVSPNAFVGIRVYGDQFPATAPASREQNCTQDTRLVTPIERVDPDALIADVNAFAATGDTAIALALQAANDDIPEGTLGTVVLFSDGRDECFDADLDGDPTVGPSFGEDPCVIAQQLAGDGVDLRIDRVETVGFGADAAAEQELRCIADSTGGSYTPIENPADAREVLPEVLAAISSPREAERLGGSPIVGAATQEDAPDFERLDAGSSDGRFTDTIEMNTEKWYRVGQYGPGAGTFTATAFGLPAQEGIDFGLRLFVPETDQTFFENQGDTDAGLPRRPTASIRCPGCEITGLSDEIEAFWIVSLSSDNPDLGGTYDLELLTEGTAFGGTETGCVEPQACWYAEQIPVREQAIEEATAELDELLVASGGADVDRSELDSLRDQIAAQESALSNAEAAATEAETEAINSAARAVDLEAQAAAFGGEGTSLLLPILLAALGLVAAIGSFFVGRKDKEPPVVATAAGTAVSPGQGGVGAIVETPPGASSGLEHPPLEGVVGSIQPTSPPPPASSPPPPPVSAPPPASTPPPPAEVTPAPEPDVSAPIADADIDEESTDAPTPSTESVSPEGVPGWYVDPGDGSQLRWWDGTTWTSHVQALEGGEH